MAPTLSTIRKLAKALDVDPTELLAGVVMPFTNGHGPPALPYARVSTDEQARSGHSLANRPKPTYIKQVPAPSSIRGTEGQHRNDGSRCEG